MKVVFRNVIFIRTKPSGFGKYKVTVEIDFGDAIEKYSKHVTDMELIDAHRDGESMPLVLHVTGYDEYDLV